MFFILSKIFWTLCAPLTIIGLMIAIGTIFPKLSSVAVAGGVLFILLGFFPIGTNLLTYLEQQYVNEERLPADLKGIIVLGGAIDGTKSERFDQISINDNAERITEMIRLSLIYPHARIVFSGGSGEFDQTSPKESEKLRILLKELNIKSDRFEYESQSRNTFENMVESKKLVNPQPGDKWVLVTSAFHLPRAMRVFSKGEWNMIPYPAGYISKGEYTWLPTLDVLGNFYKLQVATKEIVGIIAYSLTGKL